MIKGPRTVNGAKSDRQKLFDDNRETSVSHFLTQLKIRDKVEFESVHISHCDSHILSAKAQFYGLTFNYHLP